MGKTLILGNGISRLTYDKQIREWKGEVWGCNRVYLEYGSILNRLTGHVEVMAEAAEYRKKKKYKFKIYGGNLGHNSNADELFTCDRKYWKDSGTTLVAQALTEGRKISVCGFDLGGPDALSPDVHTQLKHCWVERWRQILHEFGTENITFIGYDHTEYLLSNISSLRYANLYCRGMPHILTDEYIDQWEKWSKTKSLEKIDMTKMVRIKYKSNGYETQANEVLAAILKKKGAIDILGDVKESKEKTVEKIKANKKVKEEKAETKDDNK